MGQDHWEWGQARDEEWAAEAAWEWAVDKAAWEALPWDQAETASAQVAEKPCRINKVFHACR